jgi:hypothetical protein
MPIVNIDNVTVFYGKEKHIGTHFRVASQVRAWLRTNKPLTIKNNGSPSYHYTVTVGTDERYEVTTRKVDITEHIFENVIENVNPLT